jgi:hypothetical protein
MTAPRPGSRAARMSQPLTAHALRQEAERHGVCIRPIAIRRIDTVTGQAEIIEVPCGARLASKCRPCAERNRRLRIQQIREGWHLAEEPAITPQRPGEGVRALIRVRANLEFARDEAERESRWEQVADADAGIVEVDDHLSNTGLRGHLTPRERTAGERRVRSTRHRQDIPDLPRLRVDKRTVGRVYTGPDGRQHRPSMLVTLTLPSHGLVHSAARLSARRSQTLRLRLPAWTARRAPRRADRPGHLRLSEGRPGRHPLRPPA